MRIVCGIDLSYNSVNKMEGVLNMAGQLIERGKNKWLVRVYLGEDDGGKRRYHNKTIHGNKKEAQAYLNKCLREKDTGTFIEPSKELFSKYLEYWLQNVAKTRVREKTFHSYEKTANNYIKPGLGDIKLSHVTPALIQELYNKLLDKGLSPRTVRYTHSVLRSALQQAVKWGLLYRNPALLVELPRDKAKEMLVFTPEEARIFMDAVVYSKWKALFSLLLSSGMRPGEALGLKWGDVDFEGKRITINRTLMRTQGGGWKLEEPKTSRSRRTIPIPSTVMKDLEEHKKAQAAEKLRAKPGKYTDHGFVFTSENGEPANHKNIVRRFFKPLLEGAGLPDIRLYDLRHTCATLLLSAGVNPKIVSERLGHASITLTLDTYSHVLPNMQEAAADKLESMLFK